MRAVINEVKKENEGITYPCIMKCSDGEIVLFTAPHTGMTIARPMRGNNRIGTYSAAWCMDHFKPLEGSVTLSNDA